MIPVMKQEVTVVSSALVSSLGTEVASPLAPELLLAHVSGWA
jgi:hypothetical protein